MKYKRRGDDVEWPVAFKERLTQEPLMENNIHATLAGLAPRLPQHLGIGIDSYHFGAGNLLRQKRGKRTRAAPHIENMFASLEADRPD